MSFDPNQPANNAQVTAAGLRDQFNALKTLIDNQQTMINGINNVLAAVQGQLNALTADTPHNCPGVGDLSVSLSQPPNQWEVQPIIDKMNELLGVLRR